MNKNVYLKTDKYILASIKTESEGSLFHYTNNLDTLGAIVESGFLFGYCFEEHSKRIAKGEDWTNLDIITQIESSQPKYGIATPMICFCDIPLLKASEHRAKFGDYCIGVNKELLRKELPSLNPLLYCTSNWVYKAIETLVSYIPTKEERVEYDKIMKEVTTNGKTSIEKAGLLNKAIHEGIIPKDVRYNMDYYSAVNTLVSLVKEYEGVSVRYYNEHEWRVFFNEEEGPKHGFTREQFKEQKAELNEKLKKDKSKAYLTFDNQDNIITYIIVSREDEIPSLINKIRKTETLLGQTISSNNKEEIKDIIISKITSFERIESDY